jgi:hypothetical protein
MHAGKVLGLALIELECNLGGIDRIFPLLPPPKVASEVAQRHCLQIRTVLGRRALSCLNNALSTLQEAVDLLEERLRATKVLNCSEIAHRADSIEPEVRVLLCVADNLLAERRHSLKAYHKLLLNN